MAIATGKDGSIYIPTSTTSFETVATTEDGTSKIYQIDVSAKQVWDLNQTLSVSLGSIDRTWMHEGIDPFTGRVKMTATDLTALTVSGYYIGMKSAGDIFSWTMNLTRNTADRTAIGHTWSRKVSLINVVSVTLERYRIDTDLDAFVSSGLTALTSFFLLKLYENDSNGFWAKALKVSQGYVKTTGDVDKDSLTFEVDRQIARIA